MLLFGGYSLLRIRTNNWPSDERYEFEVVHRRGKSHRNMDGLFRRPCKEMQCNYCAKRETTEERTNLVGRIVFESEESKNWNDWQPADINFIIKSKEKGKIIRNFVKRIII